MSILKLQRKVRELGRIRLGDRSGTRGAPRRLSTFRFTSASRDLIDQVAAKYGGQTQPWESPRGDEWEVVTQATELDIIIPPKGHLTQWFELWSAGGCQRRCDGETEWISAKPCICDPDSRECDPMTYLWVMLPGIQGLGTWRLTTGSWYAAEELAGVTDLLQAASVNNVMVPSVLRIEQRKSVKDGKTRRYSLPVIDAKIDIGMLVRGELPTVQEVERPLPGGRGTQRVPMGPQHRLPDHTPEDRGDPDHGAPPPPLPDDDPPPANGGTGDRQNSENGEPPDPDQTYDWTGQPVPDDLKSAWNTWRGWIANAKSGAELDALTRYFKESYDVEDLTFRNLESPFEVDVRRRREDLS